MSARTSYGPMLREFVGACARVLAWCGSAYLALGVALGAVFETRHVLEFALLWLGGLLLGLLVARGRPRWRALAILGAQAALMFAAGLYFSRGPSREELEPEGDALVAALERHRAETGLYPNTLAAAGIAPGWNDFGGWQYEAIQGGAKYNLSVGDYQKDGFVLYRWSERDEWHWDR